MKISVVTTLYNAVNTLSDCLDSVAAQTHTPREHIVIDGGSDDTSLALLQQRGDQLAVLVSEPDEGIYFGLNKGLARATGSLLQGAVLAGEGDRKLLCLHAMWVGSSVR